MIPLYSINKACRSQGGTKDLFIFDRSNLAMEPIMDPNGVFAGAVTFVDPTEVYHIAFTHETCRLDLKPRKSFAGQYHECSIIGTISRARLEVETIIRRLKNHRICAIVTDNNGLQRYAWDLLFEASHTTGLRRGEVNGYSFTLSGETDMELPVISGEVITDTNGGGVTFTNTSSGACVTINPVPIDYTPAPSGNPNNRCEFVVDPNGQRFFIDQAGRSINLNVTAGDMEITDPSRGAIVTVGSDRWRIRVTSFGSIQTEKL